jgi:HD superfamily phosphohydrolase
MFQLAALEHCAGMSGEERRQFLRLDDAGGMHALRTSKNPVTRGIALRLYERRLYKRAVYTGSDQINPVTWQDGITLEKSRNLASQIAETAGIRAEEVLVDIPPIPREMSLGVRVQSRNAVTNFEELSPRIQTLNMTRREQWRLGIYTVPEHRDAVCDAACEVLHIKKPTRQDTLF